MIASPTNEVTVPSRIPFQPIFPLVQASFFRRYQELIDGRGNFIIRPGAARGGFSNSDFGNDYVSDLFTSYV